MDYCLTYFYILLYFYIIILCSTVPTVILILPEHRTYGPAQHKHVSVDSETSYTACMYLYLHVSIGCNIWRCRSLPLLGLIDWATVRVREQTSKLELYAFSYISCFRPEKWRADGKISNQAGDLPNQTHHHCCRSVFKLNAAKPNPPSLLSIWLILVHIG